MWGSASVYTRAPPKINTSVRYRPIATSNASSSDAHTTHPSISVTDSETTIFILFGNGRPIDSYVFRPIIMVCPVVSDFTRLRSDEIRQIRSLFLPISRFFPMAAMALTRTFFLFFTSSMLYIASPILVDQKELSWLV